MLRARADRLGGCILLRRAVRVAISTGLCVLAGCASTGAPLAVSAAADSPPLAASASEGSVPPPAAARAVVRANSEALELSPTPARLMVYEARYELAVPNIDDSVSRFISKAEELGGYLENRDNARVACRVPAAHFTKLASFIPALGVVLNESRQSLDMTREHRDLSLRADNAERARQRLLDLLQKADGIETVLKIETQIRTLTEEIERLQGELKFVSERIAYSKVEVLFRSAPEESPGHVRTDSAFGWINTIGAEQVLKRLRAVRFGSGSRPVLWAAASRLTGDAFPDTPAGFLEVERHRHEMVAVTPDESVLCVREFADANGGSRDFWAEALKNHCTRIRGYTLAEQRTLRDRDGREGEAFVFDVTAEGVARRYEVVLFVRDGPFWLSKDTLRVFELVAPTGAFDEHRRALDALWSTASNNGLSSSPSVQAN